MKGSLDILTKDNLTKNTIWENKLDEKYNFSKNIFGEINLTKNKIQQIFIAKSTIRRNISFQF